jgi:hypothetical protein
MATKWDHLDGRRGRIASRPGLKAIQSDIVAADVAECSGGGKALRCAGRAAQRRCWHNRGSRSSLGLGRPYGAPQPARGHQCRECGHWWISGPHPGGQLRTKDADAVRDQGTLRRRPRLHHASFLMSITITASLLCRLSVDSDSCRSRVGKHRTHRQHPLPGQWLHPVYPRQ